MATRVGSAWRTTFATASCTTRKATVRWVSESASAAARSRDTRAPRHFEPLNERPGGGGEPQLLQGHRVEVEDRPPQRLDRVPGRRRGAGHAFRGARRVGPQLGAQRVEDEPEPDQLLDGAVVQVLGDAAALLLLRQHDGGGQRPPLGVGAVGLGEALAHAVIEVHRRLWLAFIYVVAATHCAA